MLQVVRSTDVSLTVLTRAARITKYALTLVSRRMQPLSVCLFMRTSQTPSFRALCTHVPVVWFRTIARACGVAHWVWRALQGKYLTLGNFQTVQHWFTFVCVVTAFVLPAGGYFGYLSVRDGRKRAKYQRALQEVEKMK